MNINLKNHSIYSRGGSFIGSVYTFVSYIIPVVGLVIVSFVLKDFISDISVFIECALYINTI